MAKTQPIQTALPIDPPDVTPDVQAPGTRIEIVEVAIDSLTVHPLNAGIYGDDADAELIASVREHGVTTPIEVTGANVVISGHRRLSAARQAGLTTVPAFVRNYPTDEAAFTAMLRANLYRRKTREQLTREIEAGLSHGKGVREISGIVGASKSTVAEIASGVRARTPGPDGPTKGRDGRNYPARVAKPSRGDQSEDPAPRTSPHQAHHTLARDTRPALDFRDPDVVQDTSGPWRNRIVGDRSRAPQSLVPNPRFRGESPDLEMDIVEQSLAEIGWIQPVIVNQVTGHIIDGHARVRLAIARREPLVPVTYLDLSVEDERRVCDFLDRIANRAGSDSGASGKAPWARDIDVPKGEEGDLPVDEGVTLGNPVG
jgi:ParB/RepB/Spo0J family partition protein